MPALEETPSQLLVIPSPTGKQTETRLKDAQSARGLVRQVVHEDTQRSLRRTLVKGLVDGNPPYDATKQRNAGLAWQANLNLMEGKALMDSSGIPYYSIFAGADTYIEYKTGFQPENPESQRWNGFIATRFHNMLKRWQQFEWHMQQSSYWMRLHGIGPCIFERDGDWRFRALESGAVLVPKTSASCVDYRLPFVVVRMKYRTHELYRFIENPEEAAAQGWDVEAVRMVIKNAWRQPSGTQAWEAVQWEELQRRYKNDDLYTSFSNSDEVSVAHIYVNEYSGKVSHFIVTESAIVGDTNDADNKDDRRFLYKHVARYDSMDQVLTVFFQDIGDGTWHSVRGIGDLAFKHLEVLNRLDCRMIDGAFIDGGIVLQPEGAKDIDKIQSIQWGPFTILPAGLKMQTGRVSGQLEGTMAVSRTLRNGLGNNVGMFNQRSVARDDGRGEAVTAEQIRAQVAKESTLSQGQMTLEYLTLDRLYREIFRRASDPNTMDEEALRFQAECEMDGVPREALLMVEYCRANRAAGYGSPQMAFMTLNQLQPIVPMLPEAGKGAYVDMFIQATLGAEKVRILNPEQHIPEEDDSIAQLENMLFDSGREAILASGQNDVTHLQIHLADAAQKLGPLQIAIDNGDPVDPAALEQAAVYVAPLAANCEQHVARLKADPTRRQLVPQFEAQLKQVVAFDGKLRSELIKASREQQIAEEEAQNANALDATTAAKVRAQEADTAIAAAKAKSKIENDRAKVASKARLDAIKTAEDIRLQRERAAAENSAKKETKSE